MKGSTIALTIALVASAGSAIAMAQEKKAAADVLAKAAPAQIEALKQRLRRITVFRDPATGEFRSPDPGEQAALGAGGAAAARTPAPRVGRLPNGALYLPFDVTKLPLVTVQRPADGAGEKRQGGRDEK